jgi:hypothetical protein
MPDSDRDTARPEHLREASRGTEASALALHNSLRSGLSAGNVFTTSPFSGHTALYFQAAIGSINTCLASARDAHEQVARALRRVADPIEDEQRARRRLNEAREQLADARDRLSDRESELSAAQSELGAARTDVAVQRGRIAAAESANAARKAAGGDPAPVDTSALHEAQRRQQRAEQAVREAERLVRRATDRVEEARERTDRARRVHEDAEQARRTAVLAFAAACQAATGVLPAVPAAGGPIQLGPLQLGPSASADAGVDGLSAFARAEANLAKLNHTIGDEFTKAEVNGSVGARAGASGGVSIGTDGINVGVDGGGFAGAEGGVTGSLGAEQTVQTSADASVRFGVGADGHAGITTQDGKVTIGAGAGVALGPGGKVGGEVTINPGGIVESIVNAPRNFDKVIGFFD